MRTLILKIRCWLGWYPTIKYDGPHMDLPELDGKEYANWLLTGDVSGKPHD